MHGKEDGFDFGDVGNLIGEVFVGRVDVDNFSDEDHVDGVKIDRFKRRGIQG